MSPIRFNHVFLALMSVAALCAFVLPPRVSAVGQAQLQMLFMPVAKPFRAMALWAHNRASPTTMRDDASPDRPREMQDVYRENTDLRMQIAALTAELSRLQELNADRAKLGDLRSRCRPVPVNSNDSSPGTRDSLLLSGGSANDLREGLPVLCADGVVGKITRVDALSARVQLITDRGSKVQVSFTRFEKEASGTTHMQNVSYPDCVAEGQGERRMLVTHQKLDELKAAVRVNDWAVLNDPKDWAHLSYRVGRVSDIEPQPGAPGFGQIHIESVVDLNQLSEVMVLVK